VAKVISNVRYAPDINVLKVEGDYAGAMGQFYMLRCWDSFPLLSRPISIYDIGDGYIAFMFRIVGTGTELLAGLQPGDEVQLEGPFGQGFPEVEGRIALVGGGMGTAPLYMAAKRYTQAEVFLGFSTTAFGVPAFEERTSQVTVTVGAESILEHVQPERYEYIFACGPHLMLEALAHKVEGTEARLFLSAEKRMACGMGACLVCSVQGPHGNRKVCKDGPVFEAGEVDWDALHDL